ncbi:hypothetical protein CapIbe_014987 [Capra ibex]
MSPTLLSLLSLGFCVSLRIRAAVGEYEKPSLSAWPSPVVPLGQAVTLHCHSGPPFVIFRLLKRDGARLRKLQEQQFNTFPLGPVTREHAGSYTCSGANLSRSVRSNVSDPLPIVVTGVSTKPSISAHPGPLVRAGENVTLRCHSSMLLDKFILQRKSSTGHFQRRGEMLTGGHAPADFFIGPMTLASAGTYRCYGSLRHSPYEWSAPSDPVDIIITGPSRKPSLSAQGGPVVLRLLHSLSLLVVRLQRPTVPVCHRIHYKYLPVTHGSTHHRRSTASSRTVQHMVHCPWACHSFHLYQHLPCCSCLSLVFYLKSCCHHARIAHGRQNSERRGLCSRRRDIRSPGPRDPLQETVHSRSPEAHAPLHRAHYL